MRVFYLLPGVDCTLGIVQYWSFNSLWRFLWYCLLDLSVSSSADCIVLLRAGFRNAYPFALNKEVDSISELCWPLPSILATPLYPFHFNSPFPTHRDQLEWRHPRNIIGKYCASEFTFSAWGLLLSYPRCPWKVSATTTSAQLSQL